MKFNFITLYILICFSVYPEVEGMLVESVENLGMGGPGTAIEGKYDTMYNPALLGLKKGWHIRAFCFPLSISNDLFKLYDYFKDNKNDIENFDKLSTSRQIDLTNDIVKKITTFQVRIKYGLLNSNFSYGPIPLGENNNALWLGAGYYNQHDSGIRLKPGILLPTIDYWAIIDRIISIPCAYSITGIPFNIKGNIYFGLNMKLIIRSKYDKKRINILNYEGYGINSGDLHLGTGFGLDYGILYERNPKLKYSFVIKDLFSTRIGYSDTSSDLMYGKINLGFSYMLNNRIFIASDIRDIKMSDIGKNIFLAKLYIGAEYMIIDRINLRGGLHQGYPSFGFGLADIFDYALYGKELSEYPGLLPEWTHVASLSFEFQ